MLIQKKDKYEIISFHYYRKCSLLNPIDLESTLLEISAANVHPLFTLNR